MQLTIVEIGQHVKVETGEMSHAIFVLSGTGNLIEIPVGQDAYDLLVREMGVSELDVQTVPAAVPLPEQPDVQEMAPGEEESPDPTSPPPDYIEEAMGNDSDGDEDGFPPDPG